MTGIEELKAMASRFIRQSGRMPTKAWLHPDSIKLMLVQTGMAKHTPNTSQMRILGMDVEITEGSERVGIPLI